MAEQTAVEWLFEQLGSHIGPVDDSEAAKLNEYIAKAKQIEKEQIIDAYKADRYPCSYEDAEDYYNQTYKTKHNDKQQS